MSPSMAGFSPSVPFQDLPPLPPKTEIESAEVLKLAIEARTSLESLRGACRLIPNPDLVLQSVTIQEARLSSEIENVVTTNDELYRADDSEDDKTLSPAAKEVTRYRQAVWMGYELIAREGVPLHTTTLTGIATAINGTQTDVRSQPGIRIGNPRTGEVIYAPPEGREVISSLLDNLSEFIYAQNDGLDPLVKMAIAHYQFEAIHPFRDGNGRTGRILNILMLIEYGLLDYPILYLSKAIIESKAGYYERLRAVTEQGDWQGWVKYMLRAVAESSRETKATVEEIQRQMEEFRNKMQDLTPRIYSYELLVTLFAKPYVRISHLEDAKIAERQTAGKYLRQLAEAGLLEPMPAGRSMIYVNRPLFRLVSLGRP
jgi:Fic family protein